MLRAKCMYTLQVSDVKRVWSLRQSLLLMDFEDNSSESLKQLLHQCMIHPVYLKLEEVRNSINNLLQRNKPGKVDENIFSIFCQLL